MHRTSRLILAPAFGLATGLLAALPAAAGSASGSFQVNATVVSACSVTGSLLNFGTSLDPVASAVPVDATSTLTVQCTNTTPYAVSLNAGLNAGGASVFGSRSMKSGAHLLGYQLYLDSGRATVWGDGTASSSTVSGTGTGSNQSITVYGRLPTLSGAVPGAYSDTVTITISY